VVDLCIVIKFNLIIFMDEFLKDSVEIEYGVGKFHQFENLRHLFVLVMSIFLVAINVLFKACNEKNGYCKLK